ncbi:hypothetical protein FGADI_10447 [Fusarium gaditjirri]|uniref:Azaphilone pigments biosynthesis cluster protein L N-terminal domain-containing protein n=1 Tax=Fusarium gaditjirri TaxID=282569 RepID=A0A8H4SX27_9HYPO|nr:hypothetical protein FGADI_10447 [Fusarium gaditjirri]
MEAVGAGASILTFITVAFSVAQSINSALSAIKDGPEVIRLLTDEIAQLESVLQRLKGLSFVSVHDIDRSQLEALAKKCKDDLAELDFRLKSLDISTSDGRRGRLWRKLKLCFSEKELDHIRFVVQGHVQHLTIRLHLIQAQQVSFTAEQSTQILTDLQQLKQEIAALRISSAATLVTEESPSTSARVTEVGDDEMDCSQDTTLDDCSQDTTLDESINRLMRLLEKKPCVVESDDSEELLKDIEHLLECVRKDAEPVESEETCQNCREDVSKELALMANIIFSSPSMMINQTGDGVMTVTAAKRRRKSSSEIESEQGKGGTRRDFLAKLTYTSNSTNKMLSLSHSVGNLPVLKFLIEQGLDIDEVASRPHLTDQVTPSHLALIDGVSAGHYEALLHAGADVTLELERQTTAVQWIVNFDNETNASWDPIQNQARHFSKYEYSWSKATTSTAPLTGKYAYTASLIDITLGSNHGADLYAEDHEAFQPSDYAYNATCKACYTFYNSAKGDVWDAALTYLGYDILKTRRHYPRKARYIGGYTRKDFEELWYGQEDNCPYWDDRPWPPISEQDEAVRSSWPPMRGRLCEMCRYCVDEDECFNCGVCLSSFEFFCEEDNHQHAQSCPRKRIAAWVPRGDDDETYWELVPFSDSKSDHDGWSTGDSEDGGILLQDRLEEAFSDASAEGGS